MASMELVQATLSSICPPSTYGNPIDHGTIKGPHSKAHEDTNHQCIRGLVADFFSSTPATPHRESGCIVHTLHASLVTLPGTRGNRGNNVNGEMV